MLDNYKRFALDNDIFSSIIYIWYEGVRLRPRLVKLDENKPGLPSGRAQPFRRPNGEEGKEGGEEEGCEEEEVSTPLTRGGYPHCPTFPHRAPNHEARSKAQGAGTREPSARRQKLPQVARHTLTHNPT